MARKYTGLPYTEYPVADGHYDTSRKTIDKIILHSAATTRQGLINTFGGGTRLVSAHYGIDNDGSILAFLEEYYTAYHSGNYDVNQTSIGIEHIDESATIKLHTDKQYETSIKLVADICKHYSIPVDEAHIIPHSQIKATACPNGLDVNRIINGAKALLDGVSAPASVSGQSKYDFGGSFGVMELQAAKSVLNDQQNENNSLKLSIEGLNGKVSELEGFIASSGDVSGAIDKLKQVHDICWGPGWVWTRMAKIKLLLPK